MKKIFVTGASGMLGSNLVHEMKARYEIFGTYRNRPNPELKDCFKADFAKGVDLKSVISRLKPDFFIHCAALTDVEACEKDYFLARQTNAMATRDLARDLDPGTKFVYISTDSVFDGAEGNYSETDLPSPLNNYARTKLEGEWHIEQSRKNYAIIRTNIFGWNRIGGRSLAEWVFESLSGRKHINMFVDVIFSPVTVNTLSLLIGELLRTEFTGRLNIGTADSISKYQFGLRIADVFGFDASLIRPGSVDDFGFKARRPKDTSLNIAKAGRIFGSLPKVEDEIGLFYEGRPKG